MYHLLVYAFYACRTSAVTAACQDCCYVKVRFNLLRVRSFLPQETAPCGRQVEPIHEIRTCPLPFWIAARRLARIGGLSGCATPAGQLKCKRTVEGKPEE